MKISIIIPMYNSEKYIVRCLNSLIHQTYANIEIIVIDDGSIDNSYNEVNSFSDQRIKLYKKENGGVSAARNLGISLATGDLIMFVDADDYIDSRMVEILVNQNDSFEEPFIVCNNYELYSDKTDKRIIIDTNYKTQFLTQLEMVKLIATGKAGLVCSKLVSRKVITRNNIKFDENIRIGEDQLFFLQVAQHSRVFKYVNECLYYYDRTNEQSATIDYQKDLLSNFKYLHHKVENILKQIVVDEDLIQEIMDNKAISMFLHCLRNEITHKSPLPLKDLYQRVKENVIHFSSLMDLDHYRPNNQLMKEIYTSFLNPNFLQVVKMIIIGYFLKFKS